MSAFLLQTLSAEKGFGAGLNGPFEGHGALPSSARLSNFHGSYADFMIIVYLYAIYANNSRFTISSQRVMGI